MSRYGIMGNLGEFAFDGTTAPAVGTKVVVRSERGVELANVIAIVAEGDCPCWVSRAKVDGYLHACGPEHAYHRGGRVLRIANPQDLIDQRHLDNSCREEADSCRSLIRELQLPMKLTAAEHLLGGERIIFYFTAETRVDFRELVRQLASQYRTRIEMRQVGARDEARLVGDYERCGQRCCCQGFMKALKPVSMRMAKTQKATLDPTKISGRCGRLMCCLRFEDSGYEELRRRLPRKNSFVRTATLLGKVIDTQILTQLVRLLLPDHTFAMIGNDEITERDVELPDSFRLGPPPEPERRRPPRPPQQPPQRLADLADQYVTAGSDADPLEQAAPADEPAELEPAEGEPQADDAPGEPARPDPADRDGQRRRRRRSRRGGRGRSQGGAPAQATQGAPAGGSGSAEARPSGDAPATQGRPPRPPRGGQGDGGPDGKRRRRRRRRKPGSGDGAPQGEQAPQ